MDQIIESQKCLAWGDINYVISCLFDSEDGDGTYNWVERAWNAICAAGLATYTNTSEKLLVYTRLLTLATVYSDFQEIIQDSYTADLEELAEIWTDACGLNRLILWEFDELQELHQDPQLNECDVFELLSWAIDERRQEISKVLVKEYGSCERTLFMAMLRTFYVDGEPFDDTEDSMSMEEERACYWISLGMPRSPVDSF